MKLGTPELLIILAVVLLLFGPTQLPKLTKMFGKSVRSFRAGMEEDDEKGGKEKGSDPKSE